jgi:uncharacterized phiE125 gp8 family phage protein
MSDFYEIKTAATEEPVTKAEAKTWCKVTNTTEDDLFTELIVSATAKAELITNRVFITRTFTGYFSGFECSCYSWRFLTLRRAPLLAVTNIKVMVDESLETISTDDYEVKEESSFSRVIFSEINETPDLIPYPYQVEFTAGYGAAAAVPGPIKTAIKEIVCYWHQNRGDCGEGGELPKLASEILKEYRIVHTFG